MNEFKTFSLSEISNITISNVDKKSVANERDVFLCNYMDVYSNDYITRKLNFMEATASEQEIGRFKVKKGDVLITKDSETPYDIGIPSVVIEDIESLVCAYHLALIKPDQTRVNSIFLSKQLGQPAAAHYFSRFAAGSTRYGLPSKAIADVPVLLPSLSVQKKIAHILQTIDRAIEKTEALIDKYQKIKTGLMHDLFTRGIGTDGKLRPLRKQAPELYQETPIGWIPRDWGVKRLGECAEVFNGTTPSRQVPEYWDGDIPWLSSGKVNEYIVEGPSEWITALALRATPLRIVPKGAVVVGMIGQGKTRGISARLNISAAINQNIAAIVPNEEHSGIFIHNMLSYCYSRLREDGRGSNQSALNCELVRNFFIACPRYKEQERIAAVLLSYECRAQVEQQRLDKIKKQKSGLMHDLLTGKVPVQVEPEDEPEAAHV